MSMDKRHISSNFEGMDYCAYMIRALREDSDLNQTRIASILGVTQSTYARYERGVNELPLRHLVTLCSFYKRSADYILGLDRDKR